MNTEYVPALNPDQFRPPFDEVVEGLVHKGGLLHELLREHMRPQWKHRPLEILIVDNPDLTACANNHDGRDCIFVFRGALERIYGTFLGLLSTPAFLPAIGNVGVEATPQNLPAEGFPPVPLLRSVSNLDQHTPVFFPNDQTRMTVAEVLVELALEFLIYHEIGHILGGHLEIISLTNASLTRISEFAQAVNKSDDCKLRHVLECDADAFACHVTSSVYIHNEMAEISCTLANGFQSRPKDFALLTYLTTIGALFRVLNASAPANISRWKSSHPHPAVRACLLASSTMARGLFDGSFTTSALNDIAAESIRNLEDLWADLCLPGQNPEPPAVWAKNVGEATMELFESYGDAKSLLDQYARIPRRWDNWQWPETKKPI